METNSNQPWSEQYARQGLVWADAEAAASLLEDTKSARLAEMMSAFPDLAINRAEQMVKSSPEWKQIITDMVEARRVANRAKVRLDFLRMKFGEWNSHQANARVEAKL